MITKKILIGTLLLVITAFGIKAFAHFRLGKDEKAKYITEKMAKKLLLTNEQKTKVYQINLDRVNGHENTFRQERNMGIIKNAVAKWKTDLKQVLTAEQAQKLKI